jgi:hypothetical protein
MHLAILPFLINICSIYCLFCQIASQAVYSLHKTSTRDVSNSFEILPICIYTLITSNLIVLCSHLVHETSYLIKDSNVTNQLIVLLDDHFLYQILGCVETILRC